MTNILHAASMSSTSTLCSFYKNLFCKNIEAEICEILKNVKNKPEAEILKRI